MEGLRPSFCLTLMKRPTKFLLLFLALLLPALIFVFLKKFGRNEFEVPPLFQETVIAPAGCESYKYPIPYTVADSVLRSTGWSPDSLNLFVVGNTWVKAGARVLEEFGLTGFVVHEVSPDHRSIARCALLLQPPADLAMIDGRGKIRGLYDLDDREDVDRLILEMKIMLVRY
jgi:hypothetical protein